MSKAITADIILTYWYGNIYKFIIFINCPAKPVAILNNLTKGKGLVSMQLQGFLLLQWN